MLTLSLMAVASMVTEDYRLFVGGFTHGTGIVVTTMGALGVVFSFCALIGVYDNSSGWVRAFSRFAFLRALVVGIVLTLDLTALKQCDEYAAGGSKFSSLSAHYNTALETVALSGACASAQSLYLTLAIVNIILSLIGAYNTTRWCQIMDNWPAYMITLDDKLSAYQGYSSLGRPAIYRRPEYESGFYTA